MSDVMSATDAADSHGSETVSGETDAVATTDVDADDATLEGDAVADCTSDADCADGDVCTLDRCLAGGECAHTVVIDASCDDGDPCTDDDACTAAGACAGLPVVCDGALSPCVIAECDLLTGACGIPVEDGTLCADGDPCDGEERCLDGACVAGAPLDVDDGDPCTADSCDAAAGAAHVPLLNGTPCADGAGWCHDGACSQQLPVGPVATFLPDTGVTTCYDATAVAACGALGSPWFGQDGDFAAPAMSYSTPAPGVVHDEVTGLFWQADAPAQTVNRLAAEVYCATLSLDGRSWRLPSRRELLSIVDYAAVAGQAAAIAPVFGATPKAYFWTTDASGTNPDRTLRVSFKYGTSTSQSDAQSDGYARCVSGDSPLSEPSLAVVEREGSVYDTSTGLAWQQVAAGSVTWGGALAYCQGLDARGQTGWRLPDVRELATLLEPERASPVVAPELFPGVAAGQNFWTSTTSNDPVKRAYAYVVGLGDIGDVGTGRKTDAYQVLCVRSCPCHDLGCCSACTPLSDGLGCDDDDPATFADQCTAGACVGQSTPPPPDPRLAHDCAGLSCGPRGLCMDEADGPGCLCEPGWAFDGATCVHIGIDLTAAPTCVPFALDDGDVCLSSTPLSDPDVGEAPARSPELPAAPSSGRTFLRVPGTFVVHDQGPTGTCVLQATNGALELLLGVYERLSERDLANITTRPASAICAGTAIWGTETSPGVLDALLASGDMVGNESVEFDYPRSCVPPTPPYFQVTGSGEPRPLIRPTEIVDQRSDFRDSVAAITHALDAGHPVVIGVPIFESLFSGSEWATRAGGWNLISEAGYESSRNGLASLQCKIPFFTPKKCLVGTGWDCYQGACVSGFHAVLLVGFDAGDSGGIFYLLNSWKGWGHSAPPWSSAAVSHGFGEMTFGFVRDHAHSAYAITAVDRACDHVCSPDTDSECSPSGKIRRCVRETNGCTRWSDDFTSCGQFQTCKVGQGCVAAFTVGDGTCARQAGENCANSPSDCACTKEATCGAGACACHSGSCELTCSDACQVGGSGCLSTTTRWTCGTATPGAQCLSRLPAACPQGTTCSGNGVCATTCTPYASRVCKPGANQAWWANSCGALHALAEDCGSDTCVAGQCRAACAPSTAKACFQGDSYLLDTCGNPAALVASCGTSGTSGAPSCSADGTAVVQAAYQRGCEAGACFAHYEPQLTACTGGTCVDGACVAGGARCGDNVCAPNQEDCATCPGDCPCWNSATPYCAAGGQCVGCRQDGDCPSGSVCQSGACAEAPHECDPPGAYRCEGDQRQVCTLTFSRFAWVGSSCGWGEACCAGGCSPTTAPQPPTLGSPPPAATRPAGSVQFTWTPTGATHRVTLAICDQPGLQGHCIIKEPPPGTTSLSVPLGPGSYSWSTRAITNCDVSGWGDYAAAWALTIP